MSSSADRRKRLPDGNAGRLVSCTPQGLSVQIAVRAALFVCFTILAIHPTSEMSSDTVPETVSPVSAAGARGRIIFLRLSDELARARVLVPLRRLRGGSPAKSRLKKPKVGISQAPRSGPFGDSGHESSDSNFDDAVRVSSGTESEEGSQDLWAETSSEKLEDVTINDFENEGRTQASEESRDENDAVTAGKKGGRAAQQSARQRDSDESSSFDNNPLKEGEVVDNEDFEIRRMRPDEFHVKHFPPRTFHSSIGLKIQLAPDVRRRVWGTARDNDSTPSDHSNPSLPEDEEPEVDRNDMTSYPAPKPSDSFAYKVWWQREQELYGPESNNTKLDVEQDMLVEQERERTRELALYLEQYAKDNPEAFQRNDGRSTRDEAAVREARRNVTGDSDDEEGMWEGDDRAVPVDGVGGAGGLSVAEAEEMQRRRRDEAGGERGRADSHQSDSDEEEEGGPAPKAQDQVWGGLGLLLEDRPLTTSILEEGPEGKDWHRHWGAVVEGCIPGGPAAKCGEIKEGDVLLQVDDTDVRGISAVELAPLVLGPLESRVVLKLRRAANEFAVTLKRKAIGGQTVNASDVLKDVHRREHRKQRADAQQLSKPAWELRREHRRASKLRSDPTQQRREEGEAYEERQLDDAEIVLADSDGFRTPHKTLPHALLLADGKDDTISLKQGTFWADGTMELYGCLTVEQADGMATGTVMLESYFGAPLFRCRHEAADVRLVGCKLTQMGGGNYSRDDALFLWRRCIDVSGGLLTIADCEVSSEHGAGLVCRGAGAVEGWSTNFSDCGGDGVVAMEGATVELHDCHATRNAYTGIHSRSFQTVLRAEGCVIANNSMQGASCAIGGFVQVFNSWVQGNAEAGVQAFDHGSRFRVANSDLQENMHGLAAEGGGQGNALRSRIVSNAEAGAFAREQGSLVTLETCQVEANEWGVAAAEAGVVSVSGCVVKGNNAMDATTLMADGVIEGMAADEHADPLAAAQARAESGQPLLANEPAKDEWELLPEVD